MLSKYQRASPNNPRSEKDQYKKEELNYTKTDFGYETTSSKYSNQTTRCTFDSENTITFQRIHK